MIKKIRLILIIQHATLDFHIMDAMNFVACSGDEAWPAITSSVSKITLLLSILNTIVAIKGAVHSHLLLEYCEHFLSEKCKGLAKSGNINKNASLKGLLSLIASIAFFFIYSPFIRNKIESYYRPITLLITICQLTTLISQSSKVLSTLSDQP